MHRAGEFSCKKSGKVGVFHHMSNSEKWVERTNAQSRLCNRPLCSHKQINEIAQVISGIEIIILLVKIR